MYDVTLYLAEVREWAEASKISRDRFVEAVKKAREAGATHAEIAERAGLSEGGIRMLLKRS